MTHTNKAHTATANRIARRYGGEWTEANSPDIQAAGLTIEVETSATIAAAVARLELLAGRVYVAVTNKEAVAEALRLTRGTRIGVMDPRGDILKESADRSET